jgi:hypothetical protein
LCSSYADGAIHPHSTFAAHVELLSALIGVGRWIDGNEHDVQLDGRSRQRVIAVDDKDVVLNLQNPHPIAMTGYGVNVREPLTHVQVESFA